MLDKYHRASVHNMGEKFTCEKCPFSTACKESLKEHIAGVHDDMRGKVASDTEITARRYR